MFTNRFFVFLLALCGPANILAENGPSSTEYASTEDHDGVNVVLFLAHTDFGVKYENNDEIAYLNISSVGKIKPCTMRSESNLPRSIGSIIQRRQRKECDCKKLLESSIFSLMGWARNAMGMTAAIVSLINKEEVEQNEKQSNYFNYKLESVDSATTKKHQERQEDNHDYTKVHNKEYFGQLPLPKSKTMKYDDLPKLEPDADLDQEIPIINAYPPQPKLKFNDIHKYNKFGEFVNVRRVKRKLIVEPKNTQVFEIDSVNEEPREILNIPSLEKSGRPESIWDLLGIMSAIKRSFFANFLNPMLDPHQRMIDEENGLNFDSLGQIRIPSLFQLVQTTLAKLQGETNATHANGFLLVVFGGSLSDISQPQSALVQSIKHVQETTNIEDTLIVVTGSCPENHMHHKTHKQMEAVGEFLIPIYAKGVNDGMLSKAKELFDVPVQIKAAIEGNKTEGSNLSENHNNDFETVNQNTKSLDGSNVDAIENMFNKNWKQNTEGKENDDNQENSKWANMRMRRGVVRNVASSNGVKLILDTFTFIVLSVFIFFV